MFFRLADDYEAHSQKALSNPEIYLSNPVNAFLLVKRFTTDWESMLHEYIQGNSSQGMHTSLKGTFHYI